MSISILFPVAVAILGAVLYYVSNAKLSELGRCMFFCGLLVALLVIGGGHLRLTGP